MELLVSLALLVVGLIIGFFAGRFFQQKQGAGNTAQTEKQVKEILAQQAQHHIHQTRQSLESIESQCETLKQQIEEYELLLEQGSDDDSKVPFYGEQATTYLRNNLKGLTTEFSVFDSQETSLTRVLGCSSADLIRIPQKNSNIGNFITTSDSFSETMLCRI